MRFTPYSYSRIATFKQCPYKFKLCYIDKIDIKTYNEALEKGSFVHKFLEEYVKGNDNFEFNFRLLDNESQRKAIEIAFDFVNSDLFKEIKKLDNIEVEKGFSLIIDNGKLKADKYKNDSLIRGYIDLIGFKGNTAYVIDYKTGKYNENQDELQLKIYALWSFLTYKNIEKVKGYFVFVEHKKVKSVEFFKDKIKDLLKDVLIYINKIENENEFKKNVSGLCNYCDFYLNGYCDAKNNINFGVLRR